MKAKWYMNLAKALTVVSLFMQDRAYAAQGNDLTEIEWAAWPDYCKAGFLSSAWSAGSKFLSQASRDWATQVNKNSFEQLGIGGVHHFCVGMVYVNRGRRKTEKNRTASDLKMAIDEINYTVSHTEKSSPSYSLIHAYLGTAHYLLGDHSKAVAIWENGIRTQPEKRESYLAMAEMLLSEKKYNEALKLLLAYDEKKEYATRDGEYFLAITYYKLGMYEESRKRADSAYALGYPYFGLKKKLDILDKSKHSE